MRPCYVKLLNSCSVVKDKYFNEEKQRKEKEHMRIQVFQMNDNFPRNVTRNKRHLLVSITILIKKII